MRGRTMVVAVLIAAAGPAVSAAAATPVPAPTPSIDGQTIVVTIPTITASRPGPTGTPISVRPTSISRMTPAATPTPTRSRGIGVLGEQHHRNPGVPGKPPGGSLPFTGVEIEAILAVGAALLLTGLGIRLLGRRPSVPGLAGLAAVLALAGLAVAAAHGTSRTATSTASEVVVDVGSATDAGPALPVPGPSVVAVDARGAATSGEPTAHAGSTLSVRGAGFSRHELLQVALGDAAPTDRMADASGTLLATVRVPRSSPDGIETLVVRSGSAVVALTISVVG